MVSKTILFCTALFFLPLTASADPWNPIPLVIDCQDYVEYFYVGDPIDIPFTLSGKPAMIWLVVNTILDDSDKPVAVMNGFKGWHFVNGIDTTLFVSNGREYNPGTNLTFPWDGHFNEREYEEYKNQSVVQRTTYRYYLFGYDNKSSREVANDFIPIGYFYKPSYAKFYWQDSQTGAVLPHPLLMGGVVDKLSSPSLTRGTFFKFRLGDDPFDDTMIQTTHVAGFEIGDIVDDKYQTMGAGLFASDDYNTFYFIKNRYWENSGTVVKYEFVAGGEAIQDTTWGDFDRVNWWWHGNKTAASLQGSLQSDAEFLFMNQSGMNPVPDRTDLIRGFSWDDPADTVFEVYLDEFWAPDSPIGVDGVQRRSGEANKFEQGPRSGQYYLSGDATCLTELVNCHKMIDGSDEPFATDGSGYVVWANSNGDFFCDKNAFLNPDYPTQLWACQLYEPRNFNNMRLSPSPADRNGFMVNFLEFMHQYECAAFTPDGTGIGYLTFADTFPGWGGWATQKYGNGSTLDCGGQFDGIYMLAAMQAEPSWTNSIYKKTCWIPFDSDGGVIQNTGGNLDPDYVEDCESPLPFTVSQNAPNPFNPSTTISFTLPSDGQVTVDIYNIAGQKVATLLDDFMTVGSHSVLWDATDFPAGVYFYTVMAGEFTKTMKMTLLK